LPLASRWGIIAAMRRSLIILLALGIVLVLALPRLPVDRDYLARRTLVREMGPVILDGLRIHGNDPYLLVLSLRGPGADPLRGELTAWLGERVRLATDAEGALPVHATLAWELDGRHLSVRGSLRSLTLETTIDKEARLLGWESLLPPLLAILLAFAFRRTLLCLFAGIWLGGTLLAGGNPLRGLVWVAWDGVVRHALMDQFRIAILLFVFGLVGAVGIMSRMGGVAGLLRLVEGAARGLRSTQLFAFLMGLIIFFDDYANTILVGTTMRPLADRWRVSRERLAYIVDSTAAPVAGISVLSTWVAYEISLFADQLPAAGIEQDAYVLFIRTVPYRFYSLFTLTLVLMGALTGRAFGPMLRADRRAYAGQVAPDAGGRRRAAERLTNEALRRTERKPGTPARWWNAAIPLLLIIAVTLALMLHFGNVEGRSPAGLLDADYLRQTVLSNTESARALAWAAGVGFACALLLARAQRLLSWREGLAAGVGSFRAMLETVGILILAWVMGYVCDQPRTHRPGQRPPGARGPGLSRDPLPDERGRELRHGQLLVHHGHPAAQHRGAGHAPGGGDVPGRRGAAAAVHRRRAGGQHLRRPLLAHQRHDGAVQRRQ
jgi:Na+/H+ antiporter NhaC